MGVTSILTAELSSPERAKLEFRSEFFIFDGIIIMYQVGEEEKRKLAMEVIKMRGNNHSFVTTPYEITRKVLRCMRLRSNKHLSIEEVKCLRRVQVRQKKD